MRILKTDKITPQVISGLLAFFVSTMTAHAAKQEKTLINLKDAQTTQLVLYRNSAFVNQSFLSDLNKGGERVTFLSQSRSNWQPDSLFVYTCAKDSIYKHDSVPASQVSWKTTGPTAAFPMKDLVGHDISITYPEHKSSKIEGHLVFQDNETGIVKTDNDKMRIFKWQPDMIIHTKYSHKIVNSLQYKKRALQADFNLSNSASHVCLSYINNALSASNLYRIVWNHEASSLSFALRTMITNNSSQQYHGATVSLSSGEVSQDYSGKALRSMAYLDGGQENQSATLVTRNDENQLMTLPATYTIDANSQVLLNVLSKDNIKAEKSYFYEFNGQYGRSHRESEHPSSSIIFRAPEDLPAGNVQLFGISKGKKGMILEDNSSIFQTAKNGSVRLALAPAYTIDIFRKRLDSTREGKQLVIRWKFTITNHKKKDIALTVADNSSRLAKMTSDEAVITNNQLNLNIGPSETKEIILSMRYFVEK